MQQIENRGWAGLFVESDGDEIEVGDVALLQRLDGWLLFEEDLADFLQDGGPEEKALHEAGVRGGVPKIVFDAAAGRIHCSITYEAPRPLSAHESEVLRGFSNDQLVDGFGSNPVDTPILGDGYFVHLGDE